MAGLLRDKPYCPGACPEGGGRRLPPWEVSRLLWWQRVPLVVSFGSAFTSPVSTSKAVRTQSIWCSLYQGSIPLSLSWRSSILARVGAFSHEMTDLFAVKAGFFFFENYLNPPFEEQLRKLNQSRGLFPPLRRGVLRQRL